MWHNDDGSGNLPAWSTEFTAPADIRVNALSVNNLQKNRKCPEFYPDSIGPA